MGPNPVATIGPNTPRNVRVARVSKRNQMGPIAVVIECVDDTCTVVGSGFAFSSRSIKEAMDAVGRMASPLMWRETTPGFWVARTA